MTIDAENPLVQHAVSAAQFYGVPPELFVAQINQETGFNHSLRGADGELTLAQFMPGTGASAAQAIGLTWQQLQDDPFAALDAAAAYMSRLKARFGTWDAALGAYNAGEGAGAIAQRAGQPYAPAATQYVTAIRGGIARALEIIRPLLPGATPSATPPPVTTNNPPVIQPGWGQQAIDWVLTRGKDIFGTIGSTAGTVTGGANPLGSIGQSIDQLGTTVTKQIANLTSWGFWATPTLYLAGGILVLMGLYMIGKDVGAIPNVVPVPV